METIINYLLAVDGVYHPSIDVRIGDHWIGVAERDGVFTVLCEPMNVDSGAGVTFTDKIDALEYIQHYVNGITDEA